MVISNDAKKKQPAKLFHENAQMLGIEKIKQNYHKRIFI